MKTTTCNTCGLPITYDEITTHGSLWEFLRIDGKNVALACSEDEEGDYATCASCCLSLERDRLNRRGSVQVGSS